LPPDRVLTVAPPAQNPSRGFYHWRAIPSGQAKTNPTRENSDRGIENLRDGTLIASTDIDPFKIKGALL